MKKNFVFTLLVIVFGITFSNYVFSQAPPQKKNRGRIFDRNTYKKKEPIKYTTPKDTTIKDKPIEFDLVKLSKLASAIAHGKAGSNKNGLVILEVKINEKGLITYMGTLEGEDAGLIKAAREAVYKYITRYKVEPAIKDGKYVMQEGIMLPIVFDMSIFDN